MTENVRVLIADDHPPVRAGVRRSLERAGMIVCAECSDAASAVDAAAAHRPDICLLDVNMPGGGVKAAGEIRASVPQTTVVMLTVSDDDEDVMASLRAGASGYLLKGIDPVRLPYALLGVLEGEVVIPRDVAARTIAPLREGDPDRRALADSMSETLTSREWDVAELLRDGRSTDDIAGRLRISAVTVRRHVSELMRKIGARDRDEAARLIADRAAGRP